MGVKAEVEKSSTKRHIVGGAGELLGAPAEQDVDMENGSGDKAAQGRGRDEWLEVAIEIPGMRDDDPLPVFLSAMLNEALLADGSLKDRLYINTRFHWRLYVDVSSSCFSADDNSRQQLNTNTLNRSSSSPNHVPIPSPFSL